MVVLAIETSGAAGGVALADDDRVLAEEALERGLRHGRALVPAIAACLARPGVDKRAIDLLVAGTGPGSYTGLRVGIVTAKSLGWALARPVIGVPSFDAIAAGLPGGAVAGAGSLVVAADARRERLYVARYDPRTRRREGEFEVRPAGRVFEGAQEPIFLAGTGLEAYPAVVAAAARFVEAHPRARDLARLGLESYRMRPRDGVHETAPLYLRAGLAAAEESAGGH